MNNKGKILIISGVVLIGAALALSVYNIADAFRAQKASDQTASQIEEIIPEDTGSEAEDAPALQEEIPDYVINPHMEMPVVKIDGHDYIGILSIPSLGLELPIMSEWSYSKLKISPARYSGSAYTGDLIIAAHNYRSHFGNIQRLSQGDWLEFTDMDGNTFRYTVAEMEIIQPTDIEGINAGEWDMTLFTCTVGGASRVTIRCILEQD